MMKERRGNRIVRRPIGAGVHTLAVPQCENCLREIEPHRRRTAPIPRLCSECTWQLRDRVRATTHKLTT